MLGYFSMTAIILGIIFLLSGSIIYFWKNRDWVSGLQCSGLVLLALSILMAFLSLRMEFRLGIPLFPILNIIGFFLFATGYLIMALLQKRRKERPSHIRQTLFQPQKKTFNDE